MICDICKFPPQYENEGFCEFNLLDKHYKLCVWCGKRMQEHIDGNINNDVINISWGAGKLAYSCWENLRRFIRQHEIKDVLEYGTGLSTELFLNEGLNVTTMDIFERHSKLYSKHYFIKDRAKIIWYEDSNHLPKLDRTWDFVFVDGPQERSREVKHACKYASKYLMLHDPNLGEQKFFPNDDWEEYEFKIWKRKEKIIIPVSEVVVKDVSNFLDNIEMKPEVTADENIKVTHDDSQKVTVSYDKDKNITVAIESSDVFEADHHIFEVSDIKPMKPEISHEKSRFAYIVSACCKYIPELCACLNSLDYVGNKEDVYVLGYNLPEEFTKQFKKLNYKVNLYEIPEAEARQYGGESEILCRKRYWYAAEYGQNYEAMCVLDADLVFCRNPWQFFEIAAKTKFIAGVGLEQKRMYGHIEHHKVKGKHLIPEPVWNAKDIACAPMFVNMKEYGCLFKESWTMFADGWPKDGFLAPDMESYNLLILRDKLSDRVLLLPNYQWLGTNETLLKPHTRCISLQDNNLWTESGLEIFTIHGQFYKARWRKQQLINRHHCAKGYLGCTEKTDGMAAGAMNCMYERFKKMLGFNIKIDENKAYSIRGFPNENQLDKNDN